jgi:hypothetical protein
MVESPWNLCSMKIPFTLGSPRERKLYIIRNKRIYAEWQNVKPEFKSIAFRAIQSLIKAQGADDLFRLYVYAIRDGLDYYLAYIPRISRSNPPPSLTKPT